MLAEALRERVDAELDAREHVVAAPERVGVDEHEAVRLSVDASMAFSSSVMGSAGNFVGSCAAVLWLPKSAWLAFQSA